MVSVVRGEVRFKLLCQPRFNYAMCGHIEYRRSVRNFLAARIACPPMALYSTIPLEEQSQDVAQLGCEQERRRRSYLAEFALKSSNPRWSA